MNTWKSDFIKKFSSNIKAFNTKHRALSPVVTFFALIVIVLVSFITGIINAIANLFKKPFTAIVALVVIALIVVLVVKFSSKNGTDSGSDQAAETTSREVIQTQEQSVNIDDIVAEADNATGKTSVTETGNADEAQSETSADTVMSSEPAVKEEAGLEASAEGASDSAAVAVTENVSSEASSDDASTESASKEEAAVAAAEEKSADSSSEGSTAESSADDKKTEQGSDNESKKSDKKWAETDFDVDSLFENNPNVVGWLYFEDDSISYPIVQGKDNETYKTVGYDNEPSESGSIFLDYRSTSDFTDPNSIIYGRNLSNGSMFGSLKNYKFEKNYYDDHQYFQIITRDGHRYRYRIFMYMDVPASYKGYDLVGEKSLDYVNDMEMVRRKSYIEPNIDVTGTDRCVSLSTCPPADKLRFYLSGVLVDEA